MSWGAGHILQFATTALMLCVAFLIARIISGESALPPPVFKGLLLLLVAGATCGPLIYIGFDSDDPAQRVLFTSLYRYILPLPVAVVCIGVAALLYRRRDDLRRGAPEQIGVAVALVLFTFGGVIGYFESSVDTRTPAHYHAMLMAVTLVFIAAYFAVFLPMLGELRSSRRRLRVAMYLALGGGQLIHTVALFIAGAFGVVRKTAGAAQGLDSPEKIAAMSVMGLGGLIAVAGGIVFVALAGKMLLAKQNASVTATAPSGQAGA